MTTTDVVKQIRDEIDQLNVTAIAPGLAAVALALAASIDGTEAATSIAQAARELRAVMADLRRLAPVDGEGDAVDDIARDREARRAEAARLAAEAED
ncbi:hypothetical protein [Streptomyces sp. NBC_00829]|uniref:hypothetical protein n=1 Tax=Streptomyces sp. NBC_00829 TaxID=2903679 RepID=UPI00386535D5|nr:hypothetical protein OG293_23175 [Streptomyces sp. NBC_00829]